MIDTIRIVVEGQPQPGGSKTAMPVRTKDGWARGADGRPVVNVVDANRKAKPWKTHVAASAARQYDGPLLEGAVRCFMTFRLQRPKHHYGTGRNERVLKDSAPLHHCHAPDALKFARTVEDALTNVIWKDDALVHRGGQRKVYVDAWEEPGVIVEVTAEALLTVGEDRAARTPSLLDAVA